MVLVLVRNGKRKGLGTRIRILYLNLQVCLLHMAEGQGTAATSYVHSSLAKTKDRGRFALESRTYASVAGGRTKMEDPTGNHLLQATAIERGPAGRREYTTVVSASAFLIITFHVWRGRMVFAESPYQQLGLC